MFNIKTGVIGVGAMGRHHARIYNKISNLVGVADPDKKKGEAIASEFEVKIFIANSEVKYIIAPKITKIIIPIIKAF